MFIQQQRDAARPLQALEGETTQAPNALRGVSFAAGEAARSPQAAERRAKAGELVKAMQDKIRASEGAKTYAAQTAFFLDVLPDAVVSQLQTQVPTSITLAQAGLETGYGRSVPPGNNFFGIKGEGPAGSTTQGTQEEVGGRLVNTTDKFRAYHDRSESFVDHARLLSENGRYGKAMEQRENPDRMAVEIKKGGYATDSGYAGKLQWIMATFGLKEIDPLVRQAAALAVTPDEALVAFGRAGSAGGSTQTPTPPKQVSTPATPKKAAPPAAQGGAVYVVMAGDTLSAIAQRALGDASRYGEIARLNGLANPNLIRAGQRLTLPKGQAAPAPAQVRRYTVQRGDTLSGIAQRLLGDAGRYMEIARLNRLTDPDRLGLGQTLAIPS